jgi:hypothetical protein
MRKTAQVTESFYSQKENFLFIVDLFKGQLLFFGAFFKRALARLSR